LPYTKRCRSGTGIEIEDQKSIFKRFIPSKKHHTHESGSGLGLSIAKGISELLGGKIWLESGFGIGTTFFIKFPLRNIVSETFSPEPEQNVTASFENNYTFLIAEDDYIISSYLEEYLSELNFNILNASNGKEAVDIFEQNASIDFILMDIKMPVMNGYEALKIIRKTNKKIPIIAQTGLAMSDDRKKILKTGFDDYISKSVSGERLIAIISKYLYKPL
jgi:CheY-like chemotaxis protein